jgi:hypothetical protein
MLFLVTLGAAGFVRHIERLLAFTVAGRTKLIALVVRLGDLRLSLLRKQGWGCVAVVALQFLRKMCFMDEGNRSLFSVFKFGILLSKGRAQGHKTYHADADDQNPPEFTHHVSNPPFVNDPLIHFSLGPIHYRHIQTSISKQFYFQGKNSSKKERNSHPSESSPWDSSPGE